MLDRNGLGHIDGLDCSSIDAVNDFADCADVAVLGQIAQF